VPGQLQRGLHAFGARLREETHCRFLHGRELVEPLGEAHLAFMPVVGRDVQEFFRSVLDGLDHRRMAVARAANRDPGRKIQEAIAVDIPHYRALTMRHD
jgi:hypothetical protein